MFIFENDRLYHNLRESRKRLVQAYSKLYLDFKKNPQNNEPVLAMLRTYILHINSGKTPIAFNDDEHYAALIKSISPSKQIKALAYRCKTLAEARAKQAMIRACLRETLIPTLALILPSFIVGAGVATALTHTGTLSAIIFFLTLGGLMLLGSQLYIWRHHRKNEPSRMQRLHKFMSDFYQPSVENQTLFEGEAFSKDLLNNVLDQKADITSLNCSTASHYSILSGWMKGYPTNSSANDYEQPSCS